MKKRNRTITLKLTRRPDGMWCKKIFNELRYFGKAGCDEAEARSELLAYLSLLTRGVPTQSAQSLKLADLAEQYAMACEARVKAEEGLQLRTWEQYDSAIKEFVSLAGEDLDAGNIGADDCSKVARNWRKRRGVHRVNNDIQAVRTMFKWAFENRHIERFPLYGREFAKAPASDARIEQYKKRAASGDRKFNTSEIRVMLEKASVTMRTMILLAVNSGMYSVDVADLKWSDLVIDGKSTVIDTTRYKTGIPRRFDLWPETLEALSKIKRVGERMFVTAQGNPWNQRNHTDSIGMMFRKFLKKIGIKRRGVNFGAFRHTHVSAVGDHPDQAAARLVRGHQIGGIEKYYDFPALDRIESVTALARKRLIGGIAKTVA